MAVKNRNNWIPSARRFLEIEIAGIREMAERLGPEWNRAVRLLLRCRGHVAVTGIGKSGLVGRKIASTLCATGTPAYYLHPSDSLHGDIGSLRRGDVALFISYSGENPELEEILPALARLRIPMIAMTANPRSTLGRAAAVVLNVRVRREACPHNLTPTASTAATLALGDALAGCLMQARGITPRHLLNFHPRGAYAKRIRLKVRDLMHDGEENPVIREDATVQEAILVMTEKRLGCVSVVNGDGRLTGYFTDGDLRRHLRRDPRLLSRKIREVMTRHPATIRPDQPAREALETFRTRPFDNLPVVDNRGRPIGILDEGDLLAEGIV